MSIAKFFSWTFLGIFLILLVSFSTILSLFTDWWWFSEVGFTEIFSKTLVTKVAVGGVAGLFAAAFLVSNFLIALKSKVPWMTTLPAALLGQSITLNSGLAKKVAVVLGVTSAFLTALIAAASWQDVLKFLAAAPFGQTDPLFGKDVAFYVFSLPVYFLVLGLAKLLIVISLAGCGLGYFLQGKLSPETLLEKKVSDNKARIYMGILISLFLITVAGSTYLSRFDLLTNQTGAVFGAAFTDANVMVPLLTISVFVYGLAAVLALYYGISGKLFPLFGAITLTILISLASTVIPSVFQKLVVAPNELVKETPFIKNNIEATRRAYGLDKIEEEKSRRINLLRLRTSRLII